MKLIEHKETAEALRAAETLIQNPLFLGYTLDFSPICPAGMPFPYRCTFQSGRVLPRDWGRYRHNGFGATLAEAVYQAIDVAQYALREER